MVEHGWSVYGVAEQYDRHYEGIERSQRRWQIIWQDDHWHPVDAGFLPPLSLLRFHS